MELKKKFPGKQRMPIHKRELNSPLFGIQPKRVEQKKKKNSQIAKHATCHFYNMCLKEKKERERVVTKEGRRTYRKRWGKK